jgi:uncharacterized membrane protein
VIEEVLQLALRWTHVVAAVGWVGLLQALAWALPERATAALGPEAGPRLAAWVRLAAALAWLVGLSLLFLLYYSGRYLYLLEGGEPPSAVDWLPALAATLVGAALHELIAGGGRRVLGPVAEALAPWAVLASAVAVAAWLESRGVSRRALYVHAGAVVATAALALTWSRVAPALVRGEPATAPARRAARLTIPVVLLMLAVDQPALLGHDPWPIALGAVLGAGWLVGGWLGRAVDDGPARPPPAA